MDRLDPHRSQVRSAIMYGAEQAVGRVNTALHYGQPITSEALYETGMALCYAQGPDVTYQWINRYTPVVLPEHGHAMVLAAITEVPEAQSRLEALLDGNKMQWREVLALRGKKYMTMQQLRSTPLHGVVEVCASETHPVDVLSKYALDMHQRAQLVLEYGRMTAPVWRHVSHETASLVADWFEDDSYELARSFKWEYMHALFEQLGLDPDRRTRLMGSFQQELVTYGDPTIENLQSVTRASLAIARDSASGNHIDHLGEFITKYASEVMRFTEPATDYPISQALIEWNLERIFRHESTAKLVETINEWWINGGELEPVITATGEELTKESLLRTFALRYAKEGEHVAAQHVIRAMQPGVRANNTFWFAAAEVTQAAQLEAYESQAGQVHQDVLDVQRVVVESDNRGLHDAVGALVHKLKAADPERQATLNDLIHYTLIKLEERNPHEALDAARTSIARINHIDPALVAHTTGPLRFLARHGDVAAANQLMLSTQANRDLNVQARAWAQMTQVLVRHLQGTAS